MVTFKRDGQWFAQALIGQYLLCVVGDSEDEVIEALSDVVKKQEAADQKRKVTH